VDGDGGVVLAGGNPKGFAAVASWTAGSAVFELAGVDVVEAVFGATAAGAEALAVVAGLGPAVDALLVAAGVAGVEIGAAFAVVAAASVFAVGTTLTAIEEGWPALGGKLEGAAVFTVTPDAFGGASVAAD
jgi:hypothetical protein